jgi:hypothetical protein
MVIMSVTAIQSEEVMQGIPRLQTAPRDTTKVTRALRISALANMIGSSVSVLRGLLTIPGFNVINIPEQDFIISPHSNGYIIENQPQDHWPKVSILLRPTPSTDTEESVIVVHFLQPSDRTVEGALYYTRIRYALINSGKCSLNFDGIDEPLEIELSFSELERQKLLYWAKLCRKLKFIERVFRVNLTLPDAISVAQARTIELIFRGVTEGEFATRSQAIGLEIPRSQVDLNKPPFNGPGPWSQHVADYYELFDYRLPTGPVLINLSQAQLASPQTVRQIREGQVQFIQARFDLLDHQITYRFEDYAREPRATLREKLDQFKQELELEEPPDLVELVSEPVISDVSAKEAIQIAVGWLLFNRFPDRFYPQDPELDSISRVWRVPVFLVYANGEGGQVGEIIVDLKTGEITQHTSIEEMRNRGLALAENILHAR